MAQHSLQKKKRQMLSSLNSFLLLCFLVALNLIIVSFTVSYDDGSGFRGSAIVSERGLSGSNNSDGVPLITPLSSSQHFAVSLSSETKRNFKTPTSKPSSFHSRHNDYSEGVDVAPRASPVAKGRSKTSFLSSAPYYLNGKTRYKDKQFHRKKTFERIDKEEARPIDDASETVWVLPDPVLVPTRNHESVLLEYNGTDGDHKQILVSVLGRYSRAVQWMDLETGKQRAVETPGTDPDRRPLNDLNHVASVVVDSYSLESSSSSSSSESKRRRKEVWLPCGFHNDRIGNELSSNYVRIVDLETMQVRTGPRLPFSGGACGAAPIEAIPGEPPLVCAFGGTNGNHDTGVFLPYVSCYDRVTEQWVYPFGKLPVGMDHLSVAVVPKAACHPDDPARVLVFNFRTKNYSTHTSAEILAFDLPNNGWTRDELKQLPADQDGAWYTFANHSFTGGEDEAYAPRDASGVVMANAGRSVVNFGGINQVPNPLWKKKDRSHGPKVFSTWYSTARELKVCSKTWEKVADMGIQTFALMASASTRLNAAFFCGGAMLRQDYNGNTRLCLAFRIPGIDFWNHRIAAVENFPPGFEAGGEAANGNSDEAYMATETS